eukprot:Nitzschia sp. Nitz4//scaffold48_size128905//92738//94864//NITZ4_003612-RA/size128905-augustus-gene-0.11-mRNA-1//1//CDS//3329553018//4475//frame0
MSRRRGEFEHRTSIFEGAFRAWSHLGGLDPEDLESKPAVDLDPLTNPIQKDTRLNKKGKDADGESFNPNGTKRRIYPYEPLPRSGLAHPYVQAILSPWLGPDADNDAIQLGLTTLRTWWQHRRKGESGSAIAALGTEKMKGVVEGYTRHFFTLSHCLVMEDKEQPPRSLHAKMKELEKLRSKRKKKDREANPARSLSTESPGPGTLADGIAADLTNQSLTPLERLHVAQQRKLAVDGGVHTNASMPEINPAVPIINIKNKCVASKVDLPAVVDAVNHHANQLAHSGASRTLGPPVVPSNTGVSAGNAQYGDPDTVPIVFVAPNGDMLLAMSVDGITCAHCVKIVETVLKGCNGNKSPIDGLLDAAADRDLCSVLVKIDRLSAAKRVAFESARNLAMVGYTAKAKVMKTVVEVDGKKTNMNEDAVYKAFEAVGRADPKGIFDWNIPCSCPDNGVLRSDCSRHSQMSPAIFDAFENRGMLVQRYLAGDSVDVPSSHTMQDQDHSMQGGHQPQQMMDDHFDPQPIMQNNAGLNMNGSGMSQNAGMDLFGGPPASIGGVMNMSNHSGGLNDDFPSQRVQRNSIMSFGGGRAMSFGDQSYGRAMSGLSALSIDWENMEDFDINVDHSAHINNGMNPGGSVGGPGDGMLDPKPMGGGGGSGKRSSIRQMMSGGNDNNDSHVAFRVS